MGLLDYPEIIAEPMDLSTMQINLRFVDVFKLHSIDYFSNGVYSNDIVNFWRHMELIWSNCETYNGIDTVNSGLGGGLWGSGG